MKKESTSKHHVHLPANAKLNFSKENQIPPETKYNSREKIFDENAVKKFVGGKYARE
jgi:hypothetical protein